jgi:hypothetical protein
MASPEVAADSCLKRRDVGLRSDAGAGDLRAAGGELELGFRTGHLRLDLSDRGLVVSVVGAPPL